MSQAIFLYTRGHGRTKFFQNPEGRETALATDYQDGNKNFSVLSLWHDLM